MKSAKGYSDSFFPSGGSALQETFLRWLGLPSGLRTPTYYQLLMVHPAEADSRVISAAADGQLARLLPHETGTEADECLRIRQEVILARDTLLDPVARQRYDILTPVGADPWWKEPDPIPEGPSLPKEGWWEGELANIPVAPTVLGCQEPQLAVPPLPPLPSLTSVTVIEASSLPPAIVVADVVLIRPPFVHWSVLVALSILGVVVIGAAVWKNSQKSGDPVAGGEPLGISPPKIKSDTPHTLPKKSETSTLKTFVDVKTVETGVIKDPRVSTPGPIPKREAKPLTPAARFTQLVSFSGHKGGVYGLTVSRSAETILSVSDDMTILRYSPSEPGKRKQIHRLLSPAIAVTVCNEDREAVFCDGGDVVVYDLAGQKVKATFENPRGGIRSLAVAPDGSFVLTGATDGCVRWWNVSGNALAHTLDIDEKATVTAMSVALGSKTAAFGLSDGSVCVWDLHERSEIKRWKAHVSGVTTVAYSPDGLRLLSAGEDGVANIWPAAGGPLIRKLSGHDGAILGTGWCSDGRRVVTAGVDMKVHLWDEAVDWKADWVQNLPDKAFSLAVDSLDRFILVGLSSGTIQLLPLPRAGNRPTQ